MKVFISWSGELSQATANSLREILPCMLQGIEVFLSAHDIESGARWGGRLAEELEGASFGILCLTSTNQHSSWLLFEAGALTKHLDGRACGLLLDQLSPANVAGPLSQFQHRPFSEAGFFKLVKDINTETKAGLDDSQIRRVFDKWWPDLNNAYEEHLKAKPKESSASERSDRELLEEILLKTREIQNSTEIVRTSSDSMTGSAKAHAKTLETLLRGVAVNLTKTQRTLLGDIATIKRNGAGGAALAELLSKTDEEDLTELIRLGLVIKSNDNIIRMHKAIGEFFREN